MAGASRLFESIYFINAVIIFEKRFESNTVCVIDILLWSDGGRGGACGQVVMQKKWLQLRIYSKG
jgi:hypothetical protein